MGSIIDTYTIVGCIDGVKVTKIVTVFDTSCETVAYSDGSDGTGWTEDCSLATAPIVLADIDCATASPNVKECNSANILAALQAIQANTATSNANELSIIAELQAIKAEAISIKENTDTLESQIDTLITTILTTNITLAEIKAAIEALLPELQAIKANTDTLEALIANINLKLDALIAEENKSLVITGPNIACVDGTTTIFVRTKTTWDNELQSEVNSITEYSTDGITGWTTIAPAGSIVLGACALDPQPIQTLADHVNGCIERTVITPPTCTSTTNQFLFGPTEFITFMVNSKDGLGNFNVIQEIDATRMTDFVNMLTLLQQDNTRMVEDINNGSTILHFWEGTVANLVQLDATHVQYDWRMQPGVYDIPDTLITPCADPVTDTTYQTDAGFLISAYDSYPVGTPVSNGGFDILFVLTQYSQQPGSSVTTIIPAKQVLTYNIDGTPATDKYYEQGTLTPIVFNPLTDVFKNNCPEEPVAPVIEIPGGVLVPNGNTYNSFPSNIASLVITSQSGSFDISFDGGATFIPDRKGVRGRGQGTINQLDTSQLVIVSNGDVDIIRENI